MLKLVLMTILLGGCLDSVEDTEVTSTEESELAAETFSCTQQCTNGGFVTGYGSTADAAFQNMNVCVGGGGTIECWSSNDL